MMNPNHPFQTDLYTTTIQLNSIYRGYVVDTDDPLSQGRIKVYIPTLMQSESDAIWCRPLYQHYTQHIVPKEGDSVAVFFENGDPDLPVYIGHLRLEAKDMGDRDSRKNLTGGIEESKNKPDKAKYYCFLQEEGFRMDVDYNDKKARFGDYSENVYITEDIRNQTITIYVKASNSKITLTPDYIQISSNKPIKVNSNEDITIQSETVVKVVAPKVLLG